VSRSADIAGHLEQHRRAREHVPLRRIGWVEWAVEPVRERLTRSDHDDLVSSLALVIGWGALIVLLDVRGLSVSGRARAVTLRAAEAISTAR
jgi:hypothetical protein